MSAMGQNLLQKQCKFPIYLREFEETGQVDEVVLWVLSRVMREPIAILLKGGVLDNDLRRKTLVMSKCCLCMEGKGVSSPFIT